MARLRVHGFAISVDGYGAGPHLLGLGEHLLAGLDLPALGYACTQHVASEKAAHVMVTRGRA